jgi:superfamily II DNA/RNA helicase
MSFADLGVSRPVTDALRKRGFVAPFAVQHLVIGDILAGRDALVQSPTGSGKTLAFGAPMADLLEAGGGAPSGLVLAPTRELTTQIVGELRDIVAARGLKIAAVYGGVGAQKQASHASGADVVVATPGRLEDLLRNHALSLKRVRILVIDEADRMLDMGFKPAVDRIVARTPTHRQTLFFSATLDGQAGRLARAYTRDACRHVHEPKAEAAGNVSHRFVHVSDQAKVGTLVEHLRGSGRGRTLVFVRTKRGADRLVKRLGKHRVHALAMHGNKSQAQRQKALGRFAEGQVDTLVATDVAARGLDVDEVTHVINFDAPGDRDAYVHRVGRTARAGRDGTGISFILPADVSEMRRIANSLGLSREFDRGRPKHSNGTAPDHPSSHERTRHGRNGLASKNRSRR